MRRLGRAISGSTCWAEHRHAADPPIDPGGTNFHPAVAAATAQDRDSNSGCPCNQSVHLQHGQGTTPFTMQRNNKHAVFAAIAST